MYDALVSVSSPCNTVVYLFITTYHSDEEFHQTRKTLHAGFCPMVLICYSSCTYRGYSTFYFYYFSILLLLGHSGSLRGTVRFHPIHDDSGKHGHSKPICLLQLPV